MRIRPYPEWVEVKTSVLTAKATLEGKKFVKLCPDCDGEGYILDEGVITGQEFEADCTTCGGSGGGVAGPDTIAATLDWSTYEKELAEDIRAFAAWTGKDADQSLEAAGFVVLKDGKGVVYSCRLNKALKAAIH